MRLLLLAGTGDATRLAHLLADEPGVEVIASLAGVTRAPKPLPVQTRTGGFGGEDAQRRFLEDTGITAVIDATHPFAHRISARTQRLCAEMGLPYLQVLRPAWVPGPGDTWTEIATPKDAHQKITPGTRVFLATGRQSLDGFSNLSGCTVFSRQIDPPDRPFPFKDGNYVLGKPPFPLEDEITLFRDLRIDVLIAKNAGGTAARSKLDAARALGIPVLMIARPPQPPGDKVETVAAALDWVRNQQ